MGEAGWVVLGLGIALGIALENFALRRWRSAWRLRAYRIKHETPETAVALNIAAVLGISTKRLERLDIVFTEALPRAIATYGIVDDKKMTRMSEEFKLLVATRAPKSTQPAPEPLSRSQQA